MLHNIAPAITTALAVWRGDTPPRREVLLEGLCAGQRPPVGSRGGEAKGGGKQRRRDP
jgi:hypothetical protein